MTDEKTMPFPFCGRMPETRASESGEEMRCPLHTGWIPDAAWGRRCGKDYEKALMDIAIEVAKIEMEVR